MKYCKDCIHLSRWSRCLRPVQVSPVDLVDGLTERPKGSRADCERAPLGLIFDRDRCGPAARYFEPRQPSPPPPSEDC